ncbi:MAG: NRDE family protein [Polaromonas sp.]|nr:NRDE family protein [Polaromonas sp.]
MCLAAFAINASARWPLVIASNRDEFFDRPSLSLARWQSESGQQIISGRDVLAGGTWLGFIPAGRLALLTNVRELPQAGQAAAPKSRGELVIRWLEGDMDADQFMAQTDCAAYGGFNLVLGDFQSGIHSGIKSSNWTWVSNRSFDANAPGQSTHTPQRVNWQSRALAPGVYGLSNAALDTPWAKTVALKAALADAMTEPREVLEAQLWTALGDRHRHTQRTCPQGLPDTGLPLELEEMLSSAFVDDPLRGYGTRCSTLLIVEASDNTAHADGWTLRIEEKTQIRPTLNPGTLEQTSSVINLRWPPDAGS